MASLSLNEIAVILIVAVGIGWGIWFEYRPDDKDAKKDDTMNNNHERNKRQ